MAHVSVVVRKRELRQVKPSNKSPAYVKMIDVLHDVSCLFLSLFLFLFLVKEFFFSILYFVWVFSPNLLMIARLYNETNEMKPMIISVFSK